jgi:hypothetical protein
MAETQRRTVPLIRADELETALAFLGFQREVMVLKTEGLDEEQLRRVLVPTGTNLLGLIRHLAVSERYWFGFHLTGSQPAERFDFGMEVPHDVTSAEVIADYRAAIADSDRAIRAAGDPEAPLAELVQGDRLTLRWVLAHMTTETARHAGHADILREQIDGTTGR